MASGMQSGDPPSLKPQGAPSPAMRHRGDYLLVRTLLRSQAAHITGCLTVVGEGAQTRIYLRHGRPVFVQGGLPADSVGRALVRRGVLSEAEHADVVTERMALQGRLRFGDMAVQLGILDPELLRDALLEQVRDKLTRCLCWERSEHQLVRQEHPYRPMSDRSMELEPLLLEAVRRHFSARRLEDVLAPAWANQVAFARDEAILAQRFALGARDRALLSRLPEARSVGVILAGPGELSRTPHAAQLLCTLALCDQLTMPQLQAPEESGAFLVEDFTTDARDSQPPPAQEPEETLAAERPGHDSTRRARRSSAPSLPGANAPQPFGADEPGSGKVVARVKLKRRSRPPIREVDGKREHQNRHKLMADSAFLQGKEMLRAGEFVAAADALATAAELRPGAREYILFAAWASYLASGRKESWRQRLMQLSEDALEQDAQLAFAHHVRGQLALLANDRATARACFERAVQLDPRDLDARRALQRMS